MCLVEASCASRLAAQRASKAPRSHVQLVGEMELEEAEVMADSGAVRRRLSTVHIKKCRYLEQSACVGMCVNMCKVRRPRCARSLPKQVLRARDVTEALSCRSRRKSSFRVTWACLSTWSRTSRT